MRACFLILLGSIQLCAEPKLPIAVCSPDGLNRIIVRRGDRGALRYDVLRRGKTISGGALGLKCDGEPLISSLVFRSTRPAIQKHEVYELKTGVKARPDTLLNTQALEFRSAKGTDLVLELVAGNEGVAFRYQLPTTLQKGRTITRELTTFGFPTDAKGWLQPYHAADRFKPAYEDFYFQTKPGSQPPKSRGKSKGWAFPCLFQLRKANAWCLLTESGTDGSYCGCHLKANGKDKTYTIAFPYPDEQTRNVPLGPSAAPKHKGSWVLPWRVIILGDNAGQILTSTLVTDLAPPSVIKDTSWIRPGRSTWSWWAYPKGPYTAEKHYVPFINDAAKRGWEYSLLDGGWWTSKTKPIIRAAEEGKVKLLFWTHASDFYTEEGARAKVKKLKSKGAAGIKADFWCSDRQETIAAIHRLCRLAAEEKMVVNLHGCTLPRGWHRTYPNLLTAEAVLGVESYMYEKRFPEKSAELNTVLPFTRNVCGPMDYTPFGLQKKKFVRRNTAAHELATAVIFTSGIIHYADTPEVYNALPTEAQLVLKDAPALWDETCCLAGEPGKLVVLARRTGKVWFIAGLNGTSKPLTATLSLSRISGSKRVTLITEGADPVMELKAEILPLSSLRSITMPARGGFVARSLMDSSEAH